MARLIMFNKPFAVLSQFTDQGSETKRQTLSDFVDAPGVYPAGRLDRDSEGLLLLCDDGKLQARIADPRFKLPKSYLVQVEGVPDAAALARLRQGVSLRGCADRRTGAVAARSADPRAPERAGQLDQADHPRGQEPSGAAHDGGGRLSHAAAGPLVDRSMDANRHRPRAMDRRRSEPLAEIGPSSAFRGQVFNLQRDCADRLSSSSARHPALSNCWISATHSAVPWLPGDKATAPSAQS